MVTRDTKFSGQKALCFFFFFMKEITLKLKLNNFIASVTCFMDITQQKR